MKIGFSTEGPHDEKTIEVLTRRLLPFDFNPIHRTTRKTQRIKEDILELNIESVDLIIVVKDNDGENVQEHINRLKSKIPNNIKTPVVIGIPVEALEAWFLSDEKALSNVFNKKIPAQKNPEKFEDPKKRLQTLATPIIPNRGHYKELAECIRMVVLEKKCPSFLKFKKELQAHTKN
ncbi:MAG: DUF4276 family protein [Candidatus Sumerlaeota bacterium]|nr:DUF4276 family protein [Candidatus Sumerlaeota bacterium]